MKSFTSALMIFVMVLSAGSLVGEEAPGELVAYAQAELSKYSQDSIIVKAVQSENAKGKTLAEIQALDTTWKSTAGIASFMRPILNSDIADYLRVIQEDVGFFAEIFVMDNLGANVAMTDKTSDYWQGDEGKFKNSFSNGAGSVFVDEVEFDDSAQCYMVQVSIPVMEGSKAIGAITFGIDLDMFEELY